MIEINLLPQELRKRQALQFALPQKYLNNALLLVIALIALLHILLQALIIANNLMFTYAERRLANIQPQKRLVDEMKSEVQKYKTLEDLFLQLGTQRIRSAPVLNFISDNLPQGVWLTEFSLSKEGWEFRGACVSVTAGEMAQIGKLLNALKQDAHINKVFPELELAQVARKKLGATEVVEFIISSKKQESASPKKK